MADPTTNAATTQTTTSPVNPAYRPDPAPTIDGQSINQVMQDQVNNPTLPTGGQIAPTLIQDNSNMYQDTQGLNLNDPNTKVDSNQAAFNTAASSYTANTVGTNVDPKATAQGQLASLFNNFDANNPPAWASGAIRAADQKMNARGMGGSSMASAAAATATMEAATPIALNDAQTYAKFLLSDQAATNAAQQFNATNQQQRDQFVASLKAQLDNYNANREDARQKFNVENQRIIDQSNVVWRRNINTANTAAVNAANQANAQNMFNMSMQAQSNLWQQWRDEASWANASFENQQNRATQLAVAAMNRQATFDFAKYQNEQDFYASLGNFATKLLGNVVTAVL